jgi:hypothetical protein
MEQVVDAILNDANEERLLKMAADGAISIAKDGKVDSSDMLSILKVLWVVLVLAALFIMAPWLAKKKKNQ